MSEEANILSEQRGPFRVVTLNRPAALNALSLDMIRGIRSVLTECRDDPAVEAIIFKGAGDRAFCAGGDVKAVYRAGVDAENADEKIALARIYFADEYRMNRELFHYPKPLIAIMDGITMGGGFGVAGSCRYRVATPKTVFAMPETGIGFFPDVGSMHSLTRCPDRVGHYLALTGNSITGEDMMALGIATHFMEAASLDGLGERAGVDIRVLLDKCRREHDRGRETLRQFRSIINHAFSFGAVEDILQALGDAGTPFARDTISVIRGRSPTSVKLSHAYYRRMGGKTFDEVTAMDYRLAIHCMLGHEFYEGIRAALIDRDKTPHWNPSRIEDVDDMIIEKHFDWDKINLSHPISDL